MMILQSNVVLFFQDLVHSFQTDPQVRIAVLSIEAASFVSTCTNT